MDVFSCFCATVYISACLIQDDYIDCFGDPALTGKIGTDIEDNKCSWLIVQALDRATDEQRAILEVRPAASIICHNVQIFDH